MFTLQKCLDGLEEGLVVTRVVLTWALVLLDFRALKKLKSSCLVKNVRVSFSTAHFGKIMISIFLSKSLKNIQVPIRFPIA